MATKQKTKTHSIYEVLRREIENGIWDEGQKLPNDVELAKRFGCSSGTVNRAMTSLAHAGWVDRRMRAGSRVIRRAQTDAKSLQLDAFACIYTSEHHEGVWRMVQGFQNGAHAAKRRSVMFGTGMDFRKEAEIVGRLAEFDVKGALLIPVISNTQDKVYFSQMVMSCKFPLVVADLVTMGLGASHVAFDGLNAGRVVTGHLLEMGARKIGFLSSNSWTGTMRDLYQGYLLALDDAGMEVCPKHVLREPHMAPNFEDPFAESKLLVKNLLKQSPEIDGIVCCNDFQAVACIEVCREQGIAVPEQLKITGVSDFAIGLKSHPSLTTYQVPYEEIGLQGFDLLNKMFRGEAKPGTEIHLKGKLVVRESTAGSTAFDSTASL